MTSLNAQVNDEFKFSIHKQKHEFFVHFITINIIDTINIKFSLIVVLKIKLREIFRDNQRDTQRYSERYSERCSDWYSEIIKRDTQRDTQRYSEILG